MFDSHAFERPSARPTCARIRWAAATNLKPQKMQCALSLCVPTAPAGRKRPQKLPSSSRASTRTSPHSGPGGGMLAGGWTGYYKVIIRQKKGPPLYNKAMSLCAIPAFFRTLIAVIAAKQPVQACNDVSLRREEADDAITMPTPELRRYRETAPGGRRRTEAGAERRRQRTGVYSPTTGHGTLGGWGGAGSCGGGFLKRKITSAARQEGWLLSTGQRTERRGCSACYSPVKPTCRRGVCGAVDEWRCAAEVWHPARRLNSTSGRVLRRLLCVTHQPRGHSALPRK